MSEQPARSPRPQELPLGQRHRRERIIEAATGLLDAQPYEQIQIRDVAESAGVALGTLYRYFGSKEHLYAAVLGAWSDARPEREPAADESDPESRLRARAKQSVARFEAQPNFIGLQHVIQQSSDAEAQELYREFSEAVVESFRGELVGVAEAADIITVVSAVLTFALGLYRRGGTTMGEVYRIVDRATSLVFEGVQKA